MSGFKGPDLHHQSNSIIFRLPCRTMFSFLSISCIFVTSALEFGEIWTTAPNKILRKHLFPYELCLLQQSDLLDQSVGIFQQDKLCPQDFGYQNISHRCRLGAIQQHANYGMCINENWRCRSLSNRTGFWKYFSDIPLPHGNSDNLLKRIYQMGFKLIRFVGDSMSVQLGQHLACRYERKNFLDYYQSPHQDQKPPQPLLPSFFSLSGQSCIEPLRPETPFVCIMRPTWAIGALTHDNGRFRLKLPEGCTKVEDSCAIKYSEEKIFETTTKSLEMGPKWASSVVILPLPVIRKNVTEWVPFCRAFIQQAIKIKSRKIHIVVLSSFTQHFPTSDGLYSREDIVSMMKQEGGIKTLCSPLSSPALDLDVTAFLNTMDSLYPSWRTLIGYINIRDYSLHHYDMHGEYGSTGFMFDCTHYAYSPFLMEPIWIALTRYFSTFSIESWQSIAVPPFPSHRDRG